MVSVLFSSMMPLALHKSINLRDLQLISVYMQLFLREEALCASLERQSTFQ